MASYNITGTTVGDGSHLHQGDIHNTYTSPSAEERPKTIYAVPNLLSPHFVGRDEEIQMLRQAFADTIGLQPRRCVIYGMPGLGKTQLALKFAKYAREELSYPFVFWISATSPDRIWQGLSGLADRLVLPGRKELDQEARARAVYTWLESASSDEPRKWLLVLDNATDETVGTLREALPQQNSKGAILITTRTRAVSEELAVSDGETHVQLALAVLRDTAAVTLLQHTAGIVQQASTTKDTSAAKDIVASVGFLPLAIEHAGSLKKVSGCSFAEIRDVFKSDQIEDVRFPDLSMTRLTARQVLGQEIHLTRYEKASVMAIYDSAIERLSCGSEAVINVLRLLTLMDPEGISLDMLQQGAKGLNELIEANKAEIVNTVQDTFKFATVQSIRDVCESLTSVVRVSQTLQQLQSLSLITYHQEEEFRILKMHDLTHSILRTKLMRTAPECEEWLYILEELLWTGCAHVSRANAKFCEHLYRQIQALWRRVGVSSRKHHRLWTLSKGLGVYFIEQGRLSTAADLFRRVESQQITHLGANAEETMESSYGLARVLYCLSDFKASQKLLEKLVKAGEDSLGNKHPFTRQVWKELSKVYSQTDQFGEAVTMMLKVWQLDREIDGPDAETTLKSEVELAGLFEKAGHFKKAEHLLLRTLASYNRTCAPDDIDTLMCMCRLSNVYEKQDCLHEALDVHDRIITLTSQSQPDWMVRSRIVRAGILGRMGKLSEAASQLEESLEHLEICHRHEGQQKLICLATLVQVYRKQHRWQEAMIMAQRDYDETVNLRGEDGHLAIAAKAILEHTVKLQEQDQSNLPLKDLPKRAWQLLQRFVTSMS